MLKFLQTSLAVFMLVISSQKANSQDLKSVFNNQTSWLAYIGNWKISPKWSVLPEIQIRRDNFVTGPMQHLYRIGISRSLSSQVSVAGGYAYIWTFPYGELPAKSSFPENRLWEQLQVNTMLGAVESVTRFRLEQRWVHSPIATSSGFEPGDAVYTNRCRIMSRYSVPLSSKTMKEKVLYATLFDELFINFGSKVALNVFDQNRVFLGLGYKLPKFGRIELGYLNQRIMKGDGKTIEMNHTISLWLLNSFSLNNTKH